MSENLILRESKDLLKEAMYLMELETKKRIIKNGTKNKC